MTKVDFKSRVKSRVRASNHWPSGLDAVSAPPKQAMKVSAFHTVQKQQDSNSNQGLETPVLKLLPKGCGVDCFWQWRMSSCTLPVIWPFGRIQGMKPSQTRLWIMLHVIEASRGLEINSWGPRNFTSSPLLWNLLTKHASIKQPWTQITWVPIFPVSHLSPMLTVITYTFTLDWTLMMKSLAFRISEPKGDWDNTALSDLSPHYQDQHQFAIKQH